MPSRRPNLLVLGLCVLALTMDVMLGPYALRWMGINYAAFGGNPITKIHPGTYVTLLMAGLYLITDDHPLRVLQRLLAQFPGLVFYCAGMLFVLAYVLGLRELGDVPLILDTYLAPGLIALVLLNASPTFLRRLVMWLVALLVVNAIVGVFEARTHLRLFPFVADDRGELHEDYFRATAFVGHPLRNAMLTALGVLAVMASRWPLMVRSALLGILGLGLLAFGGRAALVIAALGCGLIVAHQFRSEMLADVRAFSRGALVSFIIILLGVVGLAALLTRTDFGQRIFGEDVAGSSSAARWQLYGIFRFTDPGSLVVGYATETIDGMARLLDLSQGIENFWVFMLLFLGIAGFAIWLPAFLAGQKTIWRNIDYAGRVILLAFLVMASTSNGLAKKGVLMSVAFPFAIGSACFSRRPAQAGRTAAPIQHNAGYTV